MSTGSLRKTTLNSRHAEAGARLVDFAGWEMPVQYQGVMEEHRAVRGDVGVFDVSHMGQVAVEGPDSLALLQRLTSNDVSRVAIGDAQYGLLLAEDGGILDDLFTYRTGEDAFLTVTNASNHDADLSRFVEVAKEFDAVVSDLAPSRAMLAVQGPNARRLLAGLCESELPARMTAAPLEVSGMDTLACGTGYTGEDGLELLCDPDDAPALWDAVIEAGAVPCGLGARDTLRLEAGYHLHGNDMDSSRNPIEAGLGWACREETGFIGAESVARARSEGTDEVLVAFEMAGNGIARAGNPVAGGGAVTSGTFSPTLEVGIGMAYVPASGSEPGTELEIDVRGKPRYAIVRERPLYRKAD